MYFALIYRKKKSEYRPDDELMITIRYYYKSGKDVKGKVLNHSTGIKVKLKDWDEDWEKRKKREPIKKTDSDYKNKNLLLKQKERDIQKIIDKINFNNEVEPVTSLVKSALRQKKVERRKKTYDELSFLLLFEMFEEHVKKNYNSSYRKIIQTQITYIKEFCELYESKENMTLLIDDIDEEFIGKFIYWCNENQNIQPSVLKKRLRGFSKFRDYMQRVKKQPITLTIPKNIIREGKNEVIYLTRDEIKKIYEFKDFDYAIGKFEQYLKKNELQFSIETDIRTNIVNKELKKRVFTNFEIFKDMLLFLCSVGCRFGDMLNMKLDNFRFYKGENGEEDRTRGNWEFRMEKVPGRGIVVVPSNRISFEIWKKYSSGKKRENYLFPRTKFGNPVSNQKFNKHIKEICRIIGIDSLVSKPKFDINGKPIKGTDLRIPKWELISSHIGRRSFIREQIELGKTQREIMLMTGHSSSTVFNAYFDIIPSDLWKNNNEMYFGLDLSDKPKITQPSISINKETEQKLQTIRDWFQKGLINEQEYAQSKKDILNIT